MPDTTETSPQTNADQPVAPVDTLPQPAHDSGPVSDVKPPTEPRIRKIHDILTKDPAISRLLSSEQVIVADAAGQSKSFSVDTVRVATDLYTRSKQQNKPELDPYKAKKEVVLTTAAALLGLSTDKPIVTPTTPEPSSTPVEQAAQDEPTRPEPTKPEPTRLTAPDEIKGIRYALSVVTLLFSAIKIAEMDSSPGAAHRLATLRAINEEYIAAGNLRAAS